MSLIITLSTKHGQPRVYKDADELPTLSNTAGTAGVVHNDTGTVVVAAGEAFTRMDEGRYQFVLADALVGTYTAYRRVTLDGITQTLAKTYIVTPIAVLPSYLTLTEADQLASALPLLDGYTGTDDPNARVALLALATKRVDSSRRWQGRKFTDAQALEFPRLPNGIRGDVWNWDETTQAVVVPTDVKLATLYEANSIADGTRDRIKAAIDAGLSGQSTGSLSEQYRQIMAGQAGVQALSSDAEQLVSKYRLTSGRIL